MSDSITPSQISRVLRGSHSQAALEPAESPMKPMRTSASLTRLSVQEVAASRGRTMYRSSSALPDFKSSKVQEKRIPTIKFIKPPKTKKAQGQSVGPGSYHKEVGWKIPQLTFKGSSKRITFTDEAKKLTTPSVHTYKVTDPTRPRTSLLTKFNKSKGFGYVSEAEFLGQTVPGPAKYNINDELTRDRSPIVRMIKPSAIKPWKPKKVTNPEYPLSASQKDLTMPKPLLTTFAKKKERGYRPVNVNFTKLATNAKKWVPGVGSYTPSYSVVSLPGLKKRI